MTTHHLIAGVADPPVADPPVADISLSGPASFAEELFWRAECEGHDAPPFVECPRHLPIFLQLTNRLDTAALARALGEIVARHDPLRSTFRQGPDGLMRTLRDPEDMPPLEIVTGVGRGQVRHCLLDDLAKPFDLASGPLIRVRLLRVSDDEHVLSVVVHHIAFDGWSMRVFLKELGALYGAYSTGAAHGLPDPGIRYADYVARQRARLDTSAAGASIAYWEDQLRGARGLSLPAPERTPERSGNAGWPSGTERFVIDAERTNGLRRLAQTQRVTLAVVLATLFKLLLRERTGVTDVVIGMPVIDRPLGQFDDLIGLFLNLVLLRTDLGGEPDMPDAFERVRHTFRGAYQHGHLPYALLRQRLPDADGLARVVFNVINFQRPEAVLPGLAVQHVSLDGELPSLADLSLHVCEVEGRVSARFIYKADKFRYDEVRDMARQYHRLVDEALSAPGKRGAH